MQVASSAGPIAESFDSGCQARTRWSSRQTRGVSASMTSTSANPSRIARARNSRLVWSRTGGPV